MTTNQYVILTAELEPKVVELYTDGNTIDVIHKQLGVSRDAVSKCLKKHNIVIKKNRLKPETILNDNDIKELIAYYLQDNVNIVNVSHKYKISQKKAREILETNNIAAKQSSLKNFRLKSSNVFIKHLENNY